MKSEITQDSKKRRLFFVLKGVILPLIILFAIVYIGLSKFSYLFSSSKQTNGNSYVEPNSYKGNDNIGVGEPSKPTTSKPITVQPSTPKQTKTTNWWDYPSKILPVTRNGNDLLVLVNKQYKLSSSYAPKDLVSVKSSGIRTKGGSDFLVRDGLISPLEHMNIQAKKDGVDLSILSAYRSYSTQVSTYNYWVKYNKGCVSCADKISARPGHSQHQLGTAIDFGSKENGDVVGSSFDKTKTSKWLEDNAGEYGFVLAYPKGSEEKTGYAYESWHYRYIGTVNAKIWKDSGMILEDWLETKN